MSANTVSLKTKLDTLANALTDDIAKYRCLENIAQYVSALDAQAIGAATDLVSYTDPSGVSATRRSGEAFASTIRRLWSDICDDLGSDVTLGDFRIQQQGENE